MNDEHINRLILASVITDDAVAELDVASGEHELLEEIMLTTAPKSDTHNGAALPPSPSPLPSHRRRRWLVGFAIGGSILAAGTTYAVTGLGDRAVNVFDELERMTAEYPSGACTFDPETAKRVAASDIDGRHVEFWIADTPTSYMDAVIDDTGTGAASCGSESRSQAHPTLPWVEYAYSVNGEKSEFHINGQAPVGTRRVEITLWSGVVEADVEPNGYFVTMATLPTVTGDETISITIK